MYRVPVDRMDCDVQYDASVYWESFEGFYFGSSKARDIFYSIDIDFAEDIWIVRSGNVSDGIRPFVFYFGSAFVCQRFERNEIKRETVIL